MELRELYKEKEIKINATLLDKRKKSLQKILTENCLNSSEWRILAKWEIGIEEEETEELLIKLEEIFCEVHDHAFLITDCFYLSVLDRT